MGMHNTIGRLKSYRSGPQPLPFTPADYRKYLDLSIGMFEGESVAMSFCVDVTGHWGMCFRGGGCE